MDIDMSLKTAKVVLVLGPPCSGKSTYIRDFRSKHPDYVRFSAREYWKMIGLEDSSVDYTTGRKCELSHGSMMALCYKAQRVIIEGFPGNLFSLAKLLNLIGTVYIVYTNRLLPNCVISNQTRPTPMDPYELKKEYIDFHKTVESPAFTDIVKHARMTRVLNTNLISQKTFQKDLEIS